MDKTSVIVSCPIDTYSGYGARSRDFVKALLALEKYNVKILSQRWGNTRFGYLDDHKETELKTLIIPKIDSQPDVWIQITVPNEFQKVGKYNIGVTAGIETTICDASWIEGCNRMNLVLTSSNHSKKVFEETTFSQTDKNTKQVVKEIKLSTPVEVLFEGADTSKYFPTKSSIDLSSIKESFCFLFVGHWLPGTLGQDRKNVGYMIKSFLETFKNKKDAPALVLKVSYGNSSIMDRERLLANIHNIKATVKGKLPKIYLVHGDLTDQEMNSLYNHPKIKAMVSLTKGEGFGRPLLEFSLVNKPIIASGWSGQIDFLNRDMALLVGGTLTQVDKSAVVKNVILPEGTWFTPDDAQVGSAYKAVVKNYKKIILLAKKQGHINRTKFSFDAMKELLGEKLNKYLPDFPKQVQLSLPKLSLPKLKKV